METGRLVIGAVNQQFLNHMYIQTRNIKLRERIKIGRVRCIKLILYHDWHANATLSISTAPLTSKRGLFRTGSLSNLVRKFSNLNTTNSPSSWELMEQLANEPGFRYTMDQFETIKQIGSGAFGKVHPWRSC